MHLRSLSKFVVLLLFALLSMCCASVPAPTSKQACQIIDTAHKTCTVLRYIDSAGQPAEVSLSADDINDVGRAAASRNAAKQGAR